MLRQDMCYSTSMIQKQGWWPLVARHVSTTSTCHGYKRNINLKRQWRTVYLSLDLQAWPISLSHASLSLFYIHIYNICSLTALSLSLRGNEGSGEEETGRKRWRARGQIRWRLARSGEGQCLVTDGAGTVSPSLSIFLSLSPSLFPLPFCKSGVGWSRTDDGSGGWNPRNRHKREWLSWRAGRRWWHTSSLSDVDTSWHHGKDGLDDNGSKSWS